jgi:nitroreductase
VPREVIARLLDCALHAPNHKLTEPWRFTVLTGTGRDRFAEIRARHRLKRWTDPTSPEAVAGGEKVRREAQGTPAFIVAMVAVNPDDITREEDYAAVMMGLENLMIAAESLGLGTYLRTGGVMRVPALAELAGLPDGFRIAGVVSLGYPLDDEPPAQQRSRRRRSVEEVTRWVE